MKKDRGFTLIELMVVIAIIGILATVVLISLQSARDSAEDSNRKAAVTQIRSFAEMAYADDLDYSALATPTDEKLEEIIEEYGDGSDDDDELEINVDVEGGTWCAHIELKTTDDVFCVDSDLTAREVSEGCEEDAEEGWVCS